MRLLCKWFSLHWFSEYGRYGERRKRCKWCDKLEADYGK